MFQTHSSRISFALIILLYLIVYSPSFQTPYLLDESHAIISNQFVHSLRYFAFPWESAKAASSNPENYGYRPVTFNFFQLMWHLGDGKPLPFQIGKKIILILVSAMTFLFWKEWSKIAGPLESSRPSKKNQLPEKESLWWGSSFFAFAFFLLHPVSVQVANYIGASTTLLTALFYMTSFYLYLRFRQSEKIWQLALGAICYFLAVMSKEEGITLIALVFVAEVFFLSGKKTFLVSKKAIVPLLVYSITAIFSAYLIYAHFEPTSGIARGSVIRSLYFATQWRAYFYYVHFYFWPVGFNFDNLDFGFATELWTPLNILCLCLHLSILAFAIRLCRLKNSIGFAILGFYISILPASSIVPLSEPVSDHRDYIPFLFFGFGMIQVMEQASDRWIKNQIKEKWIIACLLVALAGGTLYRNFDFMSSKAVWIDTVLKNPGSPRAKNNLALEYMSKGQYAVADALLTKCAEVAPTYSVCLINLGIVSDATGNLAKAEEFYKKSMQYDLSKIDSRLFYVQFLLRQGRAREAKELLEEANAFSNGLNKPILDSLQKADEMLAKSK